MPVVLLVVMLTFTIRFFGADSLSGASQTTLLAVSAFCVLIGMLKLNIPWASFEKAITKNVSSVSSALIILLLIGALSGAWMVSGVVPTLVYYGLHIIHPSVFLAASCLICALVSVLTGSSWTTIATIGIALMGIGRAQGFADGWVAGAIISGAYFGDKVSPLSETTTLASSNVGVPLFTHIRYMLVTTVPSFCITLGIFAAAGLIGGTSGTGGVAGFTTALTHRFCITPWLLLVPVLTGVMIARKWPPVITLFLSTLLAVGFALVFQGDVLAVAQVGGIMAAKRCFENIPMCHPINLTGVDISFSLDAEKHTIAITATTRCKGETGVEMEALSAASTAALTIYDMCKAVQRDIVISDIMLLEKDGGKSGKFVRKDV